jgi:molecular chaperone GrpE (heat shock protein)
MNWLSRLFKSAPKDDESERSENAPLEAERQLQLLRLELQDAQAVIERLNSEIERLRRASQVASGEHTAARLRALYNDLAAPVTQLHTLQHLVEAQDKPVQSRDILAIVQRLLSHLQEHHLVLEGQIGQQTFYDPDRHHPLSAYQTPQPGQPVTIRFVGVSYQGEILQKAGVAPE